MLLNRRAVALDDRFESGYFNLAAVLAKLQRFDEATAALNKVLELHPGAEDAKRMLERIGIEKAAKKKG